MSFLPPETGAADPQAPEQDPTAQQQPDGEQPDEFGAVIDACGTAIRSAAQSAANSQDPEAVKALGAGAFYFAQAIEKLLPSKASPDVQKQVEADVVKHGATLASQEVQSEQKARMATERATDGNSNPSERRA